VSTKLWADPPVDGAHPGEGAAGRKMRAEGATMDEIAGVVGVSVATLYRRLD